MTLTPGDHSRDAWFSADESGQYTLRFKGHSSFGSFIRQYEEIQVNFDPSTDHCGCVEGQIIQVNGVGRYRLVGSDCSIVADLVTGLEWQRCSVGQTWNASTQSCNGVSNGFTWDEALTQTAPGGFRLPTIEELRSLIYCSNNSSIGGIGEGEECNKFGGTYQRPTIVVEAFAFPSSGWFFWSSSPHADYPNSAWIVFFYDGNVNYNDTSNPTYVRLVRGGQ